MTQGEEDKGEREELYLLYQNAAANLAELKKSQWQVLVFFSAIVAFLIIQEDIFSCFVKALLSVALAVGAVSAIVMLEFYWGKIDEEREVLKSVYGEFSKKFNDCRKVKGGVTERDCFEQFLKWGGRLYVFVILMVAINVLWCTSWTS